ncbi:MAG: lipid A phosphoethanolamine transferase [Muribaculaceae bacterium]|nr:lipid A phosphoethanolamine transferase [Muribaculaceae bacterium]
MLILPNVFMYFTEDTGTLTRVVNILLPLGAYWLALTAGAKPGKMFWVLFVFMFFAAFQIVLLYLFGGSPIAVDMFLNLVTTNVTEADELLIQIYPSVIFVVVVYGSGIVLSVIAWRKQLVLHRIFRHNQRVLGAMVFVLGLVMLVVNLFIDRSFRLADDIYPVNVCYNLGLSVQRFVQSERYPVTSASFEHKAVALRPDSLPEVYVLVIGETSAADHLGLYGYARNTTPRLKTLADTTQSLAVMRDAITMSNTTHKSVPLLLTATASQGDYDSLYTQHGLVSAFREAGFDTWFVSNQRRNHSFIDYFGCEAEHVDFIKDNLPITANTYDQELVERLKSILPSKAGETVAGSMFIVLHCYGSHFDYRDRYPKAWAQYQPVDYPSATSAYRDKLVNAYDNSVYYTDNVLYAIISVLESQGVPTLMLYTSDHGEDIYDDNRGRFLHASPQPTYYQLRVPMLIWASGLWRDAHPQQWSALRGRCGSPVATNLVTYHTLLDLAGVQNTLFRPEHALSNAHYAPTQRRYVDDHNRLLPLDSCGLKPEDVERFRAKRLRFP